MGSTPRLWEGLGCAAGVMPGVRTRERSRGEGWEGTIRDEPTHGSCCFVICQLEAAGSCPSSGSSTPPATSLGSQLPRACCFSRRCCGYNHAAQVPFAEQEASCDGTPSLTHPTVACTNQGCSLAWGCGATFPCGKTQGWGSSARSTHGHPNPYNQNRAEYL